MSLKHSDKLAPGMQFGKLTVDRYEGKNKNHGYSKNWVCKCECGTEVRVDPCALIKYGKKSCAKCANAANTVRKFKHHGTGTRLYAVWDAMINRCKSPKHKEYHRYGGRGIRVCDEWQNFETFRFWALENGYDENAPRGMCTIDRINNDGNYTPDNCRWVDMKTQANNKSTA